MTDSVEPLADDVLQFEETGEGESPEIEIAPDKRTIRTKSVDPEAGSLYDKWKRGKLILQPDFRRQFVWDRKKASKLIESSLLAVPLPIIYLAEEADGRESVTANYNRRMDVAEQIFQQLGASTEIRGIRSLRDCDRGVKSASGDVVLSFSRHEFRWDES